MASNDKQKQSLYFPDDMLREIMREANRLDRSLSWTVQQAWKVAREEVRRFPSVGYRGDGAEAARPSTTPALDPRRIEPSDQLREFLKGKFERDVG